MRLLILFQFVAFVALAAEPDSSSTLERYFERRVAEIEKHPQPVPSSADEWERMRAAGKADLAEMPERTPLNVVKTGEVAGDGFVVEKLHFQSRPGLYVTANLYRPAQSGGRLPAILYVCGHSNMKAKDGGSLGNKTGYEHHGAWFARHGYVCLILDTVQLGEIRGEHHGTYSFDRWWWISRGYTPAGLEAWSGIRALDYLETRPDVDATRFGVTGRSGGGAYSWWIAALDDRIKVVAPTAGITTLRNHVVDGAVEGHCDCMFMVNYRGWDYDRVAALIAPRPLLISNTDKDSIFPLDGVISVHSSVRRIYKALGADEKLGLQVAEGPHKDLQPLNVGAFAWFERFLKGADPMALLDEPARKRSEPESLRVFAEIPKDQINTVADESFVPRAGVTVPTDSAAWDVQHAGWMKALRQTVFAAWPEKPCDLVTTPRDGIAFNEVAVQFWDFTPQEPWRLRMWVLRDAAAKPEEIREVTLEVLDAKRWAELGGLLPEGDPGNLSAFKVPAPGAFNRVSKELFGTKKALAFVCPRGVGPTEWSGAKKTQTQCLRRFYLLGETLDGMQAYDIRRAIALFRETPYGKTRLLLRGEGRMGVNALYASLFEDGIAGIELTAPPVSHMDGPVYPGVLRFLDVPQAVAMAAARSKVVLRGVDKSAWTFPIATAAMSGRRDAIEVNADLSQQ
jgi:dienelactone hydrolase